MKKRGLRLAVIGFILGITAGGAILYVQNYIGRELREMLQKEVHTSTGCDFAIDDISVSLIRLRAHAVNPRIQCKESAPLFFESLDASFDISHLREHLVYIARLRLHGGKFRGISPESETYKFIDSLVAPIAPERDYPGRWKLKLRRLEILPSTVFEKIGESQLEAQNFTLAVERTPDNNFELLPAIGKLSVTNGKEGAEKKELIHLGELKLTLLITDDYFEFKSLRLLMEQSILELTGQVDKLKQNALDAKLAFKLDQEANAISRVMSGGLSGEGKAAGSLESPDISGFFRNSTKPFSLKLDEFEIPGFEDLTGSFRFRLSAGKPSLEIGELSARGPEQEISLTAPFVFRDGKLNAAIGFSVGSIESDGIKLLDFAGHVSVKGSLEEPSFDGAADLAYLVTGGRAFEALKLGVKGTPEVLEFSVAHSDDGRGGFSWTGILDAEDGLEIRESVFKSSALSSAYLMSEVGAAAPDSMRIDAEGSISGKPEALNGSIRINLTPQDENIAPLAGDLKIENQQLRLNLADSTKNITGSLDIDLNGASKGKLSLAAKSEKDAGSFLGVKCTDTDARAEYIFDFDAWQTGSGTLEISRLSVGCQPYELKLTAPASLAIEKGTVKVGKLNLQGRDSNMLLSGSVALGGEIDLTSEGAVDLSALGPLIPKADELKGKFNGDIHISGPLTEPRLDGEAILTEGAFYLESSNIDIDNVQAHLRLNGKEISVESLIGDINGGRIALLGTIVPLDLASSRLETRFSDVLVFPADDLSMLLSAELTVTTAASGAPFVQGDISIDSAEFERTFDVRVLLRAVSEYLLARQKFIAGASSASLPEIGLDVRVEGSRNIFVFTNWLNAELKTDILVQGTAADPQVTGKVDVINGWLGLKNRKFEITSGTVRFSPELAGPELDLTAEANLQSRVGETVLVVLEAHGPVGSPKINLSSDRAYSERELAALLTTGTALGTETRKGSLEAELDFQQSGGLLPGREEGFTLKNLFSKLTDLDSLTIEPSYNFLTGTVEPALVARKKLFDRMTLEGESFIASRESLTRIQGVYALAPSINLYTSVESNSTRADSAIEPGIVFTILSGRREFLDLQMTGNSEFESGDIERALRINAYSRIACSEAGRLERALIKHYQSSGFFEAKVTSETETEGALCRRLAFKIDEGPRSTVRRITVAGEAVAGIPGADKILAAEKDQTATERFREEKENALVAVLRNEGYISARVKAEYVPVENTAERDLSLTVQKGDPVTFIFSGNTIFTEVELLNSINLFTRKIPFGRNTINILVSNIERKYREAGYLYATISSRKEEQSGRTIYYVIITEEQKVPVRRAAFNGNQQIDDETLRELLMKKYPEDYLSILAPPVAFDEELQTKAYMIKQVYADQGYSEVEVTHLIRPDEDGKAVEVIFVISEGSAMRADWLEFSGIPAGFVKPDPPEAPYTIAEANTYFNQTLSRLRDAGYINAAAESEFDEARGVLLVRLKPGALTHVESITVEGTQKISQKVVLKNILLKSGDAWDAGKMDESKKKLLRLGLFSRITMLPADGALDEDNEALVIRLEERALQSLSVGGGANSSYGAHIFAEATDKQLFSDGRSLSLITDIYYEPRESGVTQGAAGLIYTDPNFVVDNYVLTEDLRYQKFDNSTLEYDLDRYSLASYISRTWEHSTTFSFGHTFQQENLDNVSPGAILSHLDTGIVNLSFLSGQFSYDQRDAPLQATTGYAIDFDYKLASTGLGSEADFAAIGGRISWLQPFNNPGRGFSFALSSKAASAWAFSDTPDVPITQRFYLGGRNTIRGFRENSLGPRGADDAIIGGDLLVANNFELRYMFSNYTEAHIFLDAGTVYLKERSLAFDDMRYSSGAGVRFLSPIGPIGFDIAHPLDEQSGEPSVRFHFTVGSNF